MGITVTARVHAATQEFRKAENSKISFINAAKSEAIAGLTTIIKYLQKARLWPAGRKTTV
jgi:hypothetical protein